MNLKKISIFSLGLSMAITGISVFATDNNLNSTKTSIEMLTQEEIRNGKNIEYARYYAVLIAERGLSEQKARKKADIYFAEIEAGANTRYADYYATLIVERGLTEQESRRRAEEFTRRKEVRDECSNCYYKRVKLEKSDRIIMPEISYKGFQERIYKKEIELGKSLEYAKYYALLKARRFTEEEARRRAEKLNIGTKDEYSNYYHKEVKLENLELDSQLEKEILKKEIESGKSLEYAKYYVLLKTQRRLDDAKARYQAMIYFMEIISGRSEEYADCYATLILRGCTEKEAREQAEIFIKSIMR